MNLQSLAAEPTGANRADEWESLNRIIHRRRSVRRYRAQTIAPEVLTSLLEAATWAPSAHNRQPWRFCVVASSEGKARLSAAMGEQWRADLSADNADPEFIERRVAISHARISRPGACQGGMGDDGAECGLGLPEFALGG
jgi:hypothetical protein